MDPLTLSEIKTTIKITGFTRSYPDRTWVKDFDGSIKQLVVNAEPEFSADLEIEVETDDGRKTVHQADLPIDHGQELHLRDILKWATKQHRNSLLTDSAKCDKIDSERSGSRST